MELRKFFSSMYVITIILLSFLAVVASFQQNIFPLNLVAAILTTTLVDTTLKIFYLKKQISFPYSATISGLIIGSVAPINSPVYVGMIAGLLAMLSKFFIRIKNSHIFNPAALGLLTSLAAFSLGDEWWSSVNILFGNYFFPLSIILIISNYKAMKLKIALSFLTIFFISIIIFNSSLRPLSPFDIFLLLPFFYAFIMVSEPKTSPYGTKSQIIFGIFIAVLLLFLVLLGIGYSLFIALLIGNLAYAIYRNFLQH